MRLGTYRTESFYDEMFEADGEPRPRGAVLAQRLAALSDGELQRRQKAADLALLNMGITFNVYGHEAGTEKIWPFDIIPRIMEFSEWDFIERGLKQRIHALNLFIDDIYHDQKIIRDGVIPEWLIHSGKCFLQSCAGLRRRETCGATSPGPTWSAIATVSSTCWRTISLSVRRVVRAGKPRSDEADLPPDVRRPVDHVGRGLSRATAGDAAIDRAAAAGDDPMVVVLTPGIYNSAYFEHCFLAQQMGVELVQGPDLLVDDGYVVMRTTTGLKRVDVIYRRIDDDFLDPDTFRPDSVLGVRGLMDVYRAGNVALANAPGTGIADDKAVYAYVPQIIKYYLGEDIQLANVPTFICGDPQQCQHVLANLDQLVVKPTNESGGYGIVLGPRASKIDLEQCRERILANPQLYCPADARSVARADHRGGPPGRTPRRPAPLYTLRWRQHVRAPRRTHPGGAGQRFDGRQLFARGREQRYLGPQELDPAHHACSIL